MAFESANGAMGVMIEDLSLSFGQTEVLKGVNLERGMSRL